MSTSIKIVLLIVIVIVAGTAIWWWSMGQGSPVGYNTTNSGNPGGTTNTPSGGSSLSQGNTNAELNQDLAQIDSQVNGFSSDSASIDQSLNDQSVSQTQL